MTWIAFSEREPTDEEKRDGIWLGKHDKMRSCPWSIDSDTSYLLAIKMGPYTHFSPVTPPTDLPPKPLPELSEGSEWEFSAYPTPTIIRYEFRYWLSDDGCALCIETDRDETTVQELPLADIEALKAVGK